MEVFLLYIPSQCEISVSELLKLYWLKEDKVYSRECCHKFNLNKTED